MLGYLAFLEWMWVFQLILLDSSSTFCWHGHFSKAACQLALNLLKQQMWVLNWIRVLYARRNLKRQLDCQQIWIIVGVCNVLFHAALCQNLQRRWCTIGPSCLWPVWITRPALHLHGNSVQRAVASRYSFRWFETGKTFASSGVFCAGNWVCLCLCSLYLAKARDKLTRFRVSFSLCYQLIQILKLQTKHIQSFKDFVGCLWLSRTEKNKLLKSLTGVLFNQVKKELHIFWTKNGETKH